MDRARADLVLALVLARGSRDHALECATLGTLGNLSQLELRTEDAGRADAEALAIARAEGLRRQEGVMLSAIGLGALDAGAFAQAEASCRQALKILREVGDRRFEGTVLGQLATICSEQGRTDEARTSPRRPSPCTARSATAASRRRSSACSASSTTRPVARRPAATTSDLRRSARSTTRATRPTLPSHRPV
jgi:hypothetical protein